MSGRIIAIGDIHGCSEALNTLLREIQPTSADTLITLGDYVDRGPNSAAVIEILVNLVSSCRLVPLIGNHEIMMANALSNRSEYDYWVNFGGNMTLKSYGGDLRQIPAHHRTFINHCQRYFETEEHFFVHACFDAELALEQQPDDVLFWQHITDSVPPRHHNGKTAIVGHTPQIDGDILDLGHVKIIDTFCYGDKWLTAYDVNTGQIWQARTDGMLRETNGKTTVGPLDSADAALESRDELAGLIDPLFADAPQPVVSPMEYSGDQFRQLAHDIVERLGDHLDSLPHQPLKTDEVALPFLDQIDEPFPTDGTEVGPLLDSLFRDYIPNSFNTASPGYLAYIPGGGIPDASLGNLIARVTNRFPTVWTASPALAQIESTVIRWFCQMVGYKYGDSAGGYLASGGSIANQSAIVTARTHLLKKDFSRATIYASDQSHHCLKKAAFLAGIPIENFREIDSNDEYQVNVGKVRAAMNHDLDNGFRPFLIIGNAGTTNTGAIDDLVGLATLAKEFHTWFHVDGAYGGFFMLTKRGREAMKGMQRADSIVIDPHKGMFLPYGSGCLLVKNHETLSRAHGFTSEYMPEMTGEIARTDFCELSPELSREHRGLPIWLPVKRHGFRAFRDQLDEKLDLIQWSHQKLIQMSFQNPAARMEIVAPPQLSTLAFRVVISGFADERLNELNQRLLDRINESQRVMLTSTTLNGIFVIRICILSFRTHGDRMMECMQIIRDSVDVELAEIGE